MAGFGVSVPDELLEEVDGIARGWSSNRSNAIVRIIQEWLATQRINQELAGQFLPPCDALGQAFLDNPPLRRSLLMVEPEVAP